MNLRLDWCSVRAARYACERWHYSGKYPGNKTIKIGVWENREFIGCVVFGQGSTPQLAKPYGLRMSEICELNRVALRDHSTPVSRIISIAMKIMRAKCPKIKAVVSFADPEQGHHGGIYQAGNWAYTGRSAPSKFPYFWGKTWHPRYLASLVKKDPKFREKTPVTFVKKPGKHRYIYCFDDKVANIVGKMKQPYPKRAGSKDSVASGFQSEEGGAIPTPALQS